LEMFVCSCKIIRKAVEWVIQTLFQQCEERQVPANSWVLMSTS
jgi:hypothetical protein